MALIDKLAEADIDALLERYDQTEPRLQRRITVEFMLRLEKSREETGRLRAGLEMLAQVRHVSGSAQATFRRNLQLVDAVLAGADVHDLATVEAIAAGTWQPPEQATVASAVKR
jgi:hypothetical protein